MNNASRAGKAIKPIFKSFDLSAFDTPLSPHNQIASVISIELSNIIEDPDQPRQQFNAEDLKKFSAEIAVRGVMSPIQVRPAKTGIGQYQIIQGARRFRASQLAGLKVIPAIVRTDETIFDSYSQVTENTQRESLPPLDIARFIAQRKALGETNTQIAENLKEPKEYVSKHLALLDAPDFIQEALANGVVQGVQSAYHLYSIYKKSPEVARLLVLDSEHLTNAEILSTLRGLNQSQENTDPHKMKVSVGIDEFESINANAGPIAQQADSGAPTPNTVPSELTTNPIELDELLDRDEDGVLPNPEITKTLRVTASDHRNEKAVEKITKTNKGMVKGFIQNLELQLKNSAAKQVILSISEAKLLKVMLGDLL